MAPQEPKGSASDTSKKQLKELATITTVPPSQAGDPHKRRPLQVRLDRPELENAAAAPLYLAILLHTESIGFDAFNDFVNAILCPKNGQAHADKGLLNKWKGLDPYQALRTSAEVFLLSNAGVWRETKLGGTLDSLIAMIDQRLEFVKEHTEVLPDDWPKDDSLRPQDRRSVFDSDATYNNQLEHLAKFFTGDKQSYLDKIFSAQVDQSIYKASPFCIAGADPTLPCLLELLWSYWHEEGMLSQTLNAVSRRFQNMRRPGAGPDPLADFELSSLRPLSNLLWGYVNDEPNRLSVLRRAYEYQHHYGLTLYGKATQGIAPADSRSRFIEAFHELLRRTALFYQQDDDMTVQADGFPLLNALKEVHLVLSEGAHNQFRDLPWTARVEMLIEQWLLSRPEMRDFLRGRWMVPYTEEWMGSVDAMKRLQGWSDTSVIHFRDLGTYGERLLLSIRHYLWMPVNDHQEARTWARFWRPEVQGYLHAYRAATGIDLTSAEQVDATMPSELLRRRLADQHRTSVVMQPGSTTAALPAGSGGAPRMLPSGARTPAALPPRGRIVDR